MSNVSSFLLFVVQGQADALFQISPEDVTGGG